MGQGANDKIIYMDSLKHEVPKGDHKYYKVIKDYSLSISPFKITVYSKSGNILNEGIYSDNKGKVCNDAMTFYYDNGTERSTTMYLENYAWGRLLIGMKMDR